VPNVAGCFLAADMLLAGLQREPQGGPSLRVFRHADQTPRHPAFEGVASGEVSRVRSAVAERHAEPLAAAYRDVRAKFSRRRHNVKLNRSAAQSQAPRARARFR